MGESRRRKEERRAQDRTERAWSRVGAVGCTVQCRGADKQSPSHSLSHCTVLYETKEMRVGLPL
jgi:hypothetical protein